MARAGKVDAMTNQTNKKPEAANDSGQGTRARRLGRPLDGIGAEEMSCVCACAKADGVERDEGERGHLCALFRGRHSGAVRLAFERQAQYAGLALRLSLESCDALQLELALVWGKLPPAINGALIDA